jgi:hypothetical protein
MQKILTFRGENLQDYPCSSMPIHVQPRLSMFIHCRPRLSKKAGRIIHVHPFPSKINPRLSKFENKKKSKNKFSALFDVKKSKF